MGRLQQAKTESGDSTSSFSRFASLRKRRSLPDRKHLPLFDAPAYMGEDQCGFTLLELLIAITVFAILSTIIYSGLKTVLDTEEQTRRHMDQLSQVQIGLHLIQQDIEQAVARPIRDEFGDPLPAMRSGDLTGLLMEFTHGGYPNPLKLKRSGLQRVAYQFEDNKLYRLTWSVLDRAQDSTPRKSLLLESLISVEINFFDQQMKIHGEWPTVSPENGEENSYPLPKAVEISLELERIGKISRLLRVSELVNK